MNHYSQPPTSGWSRIQGSNQGSNQGYRNQDMVAAVTNGPAAGIATTSAAGRFFRLIHGFFVHENLVDSPMKNGGFIWIWYDLMVFVEGNMRIELIEKWWFHKAFSWFL